MPCVVCVRPMEHMRGRDPKPPTTNVPAVMSGMRKWVSVVSSIMMTTKDMVRRVNPAKKAAAPIRAKTPGSILCHA